MKSNGNASDALRSQLSTVAVLSTFGFVAISAICIGLFVIHKRSPSVDNGKFSLPIRQDNDVLFREFHSEDVLDSERSVCASSDLASSKSSSQPASDLGVAPE